MLSGGADVSGRCPGWLNNDVGSGSGQELNPVISRLQAGGIEISAVHKHLSSTECSTSHQQ